MKHRYSPQPLEAYFIPGVDNCEIRTVAQSPWSLEIWNLMWLSLPSVDTLPGSTPKGYWRNYRSWSALVGSIIADAVQDETLRRMLAEPAAVFHSWFCAEPDFTIYDTWDVAGPHWVETVADRSNAAAVRALSLHPVVYAKDCVLRINFPKAA